MKIGRLSSAVTGPIMTHTKYETDGPLAILTFNRPEARNAMTWEMYDALVDACDQVDRDASIRVLILRGAGGKAFVAGTDISQFQHFADREDGLKYEERLDAVLDRWSGSPSRRSRRCRAWRPAAGAPSRSRATSASPRRSRRSGYRSRARSATASPRRPMAGSSISWARRGSRT